MYKFHDTIIVVDDRYMVLFSNILAYWFVDLPLLKTLDISVDMTLESSASVAPPLPAMECKSSLQNYSTTYSLVSLYWR